MKSKYNFISDDGHGWLSVPLKEIAQLGIKDTISQYSYINGKSAYLEEDSDAGKFLDARKKAGHGEPTFKEIIHDGRSPVRNYYDFTPRNMEYFLSR